MKRSECRYCGRHAYHDGKCYADSRAGKPIENYTECQWARTKKVTIKNNDMEKLDLKKHVFKPFDKVLVCNSDNEWKIGFFDFDGGDVEHHHYYVIGSGWGFDQCLPYEGNEHLKGTTNKPNEE